MDTREISLTDLRYLFEKAAKSYPYLYDEGCTGYADVPSLFEAIAELEESLGGDTVRKTMDKVEAEIQDGDPA